MRGQKLSFDSFVFSPVEGTDYSVGSRQVVTNLFGHKPVHAIVTKTQNGSKRLFICTKAPDRLLFAFDSDKLGRTSAFAKANVRFLPLTIYSMRWHIEVAYYEQKKFWSFGAYMLRSKVGIERLTNLLTVLYAFMTLLPFYDSTFFSLPHNSPQQSRFVIGMTIWHELFWRLSISTAYLQIIYLLLFLSVYKPFIFPKTWKLVQNIRQSLSF